MTEGILVPTDSPAGDLRHWETQVVEAVGNVIEFWGFKRNQGRVWALLYLRDEPMTAPMLQARLSLSKGAVSMITREMEQWTVVTRFRPPGSSVCHFAAKTDFMRMIGRVLRRREIEMLARVRADLEAAESEAAAAGDVAPEILARIGQMRALAVFVERAVNLFIQTARFDIRGIVDALQSVGGRRQQS